MRLRAERLSQLQAWTHKRDGSHLLSPEIQGGQVPLVPVPWQAQYSAPAFTHNRTASNPMYEEPNWSVPPESELGPSPSDMELWEERERQLQAKKARELARLRQEAFQFPPSHKKPTVYPPARGKRRTDYDESESITSYRSAPPPRLNKPQARPVGRHQSSEASPRRSPNTMTASAMKHFTGFTRLAGWRKELRSSQPEEPERQSTIFTRAAPKPEPVINTSPRTKDESLLAWVVNTPKITPPPAKTIADVSPPGTPKRSHHRNKSKDSSGKSISRMEDWLERPAAAPSSKSGTSVSPSYAPTSVSRNAAKLAAVKAHKRNASGSSSKQLLEGLNRSGG